MKSQDYTLNCQLSSNTSRWLCPVCLGINVKHAAQYLWVASPYSRCYSQFSAEIFDLKRQCSMEASCSWSRNSDAPFHHPVLCWKLSVHPVPDSGWQKATPWLQRSVEVLQIICQAKNNNNSDYDCVCPPPFVVGMMEHVCSYHSIITQWNPLKHHCPVLTIVPVRFVGGKKESADPLIFDI